MSQVTAPTAESTVLNVDKLSVSTSHKALVKHITFTVGRGERVGLIGESGSGKSITSMAVFGLLPDTLRTGGSVTLAGVDSDLTEVGERQYGKIRGKKMAMVFQEPMTALNPVMKVGKQVSEALLQHNPRMSKSEAKKRSLGLLEEVKIPDPARTLGAYPFELSGGQRQRVALAMAIANEPLLLICDEPTTALDVTVQAHMLALIDEAVRRNNSALLFITHDLAVVATLCERVIVMYGGEMLEIGPVSEVFQNPKHPYTKSLLAASNLEMTDDKGYLRTIPSDLFNYRTLRARCPYCSEMGLPATDEEPSSRWITTETGGYACWHEEVAR